MKDRLLGLLNQQRILGGAAVLAVLQFGASFAGLIRDRVLVQTFPQLEVVDVYVASFRLSDLVFQMFIMASFSVALVPLLAEKKVQNSTEEKLRLLTGITTIASLFFMAIGLALWFSLRSIAPYIVQFEGATLDLYITFARLAILTNLLFVVGNAFGQYLITEQKYIIYGLTPILYSLGTIVGTVALSSPNTFGQLGPMIGSITGAVLYTAIRVTGVLHDAKTWRLPFTVWHPDVIQALVLMIPRTLALGALQLQLLFFDRIASGLPTGSVTINAYARNFQSVLVGMVGIALAQSSFSLLSQSYATKQGKRFWAYMRKGLYTGLTLSIPGALALVIATPIAAHIIGLEGNAIFTLCLSIYAISIPLESANHLLFRGYYAIKHTGIPSVISVISGLTAIYLAWQLQQTIGIYAIPTGFVVAQAIQLVALSILLRTTAAKRNLLA